MVIWRESMAPALEVFARTGLPFRCRFIFGHVKSTWFAGCGREKPGALAAQITL